MAVYTQITQGDINTVCDNLQLGECLDWWGIEEGIENSNFGLRTQTGRWILTLFEKRVASADLPYFVGLMRHLGGKSTPTPVPKSDSAGNMILQVRDRAAVVVSFLSGRPVTDPSQKHGFQIGKAMAHMHLDGADFSKRRENALGWQSWRSMAAGLSEYGLDALADPALINMHSITSDAGILVAKAISRIEKEWCLYDLPLGNIHADLFLDNVFFDESRLSGVIDFYFAAYDCLLLDIATTINAWCFDDDGCMNVALSAEILRGYQSVRELTVVERQALPTVMLGSALRFCLTRLYDWTRTSSQALVQRKDPQPMLRRLDFHLNRGDLSDYGFGT